MRDLINRQMSSKKHDKEEVPSVGKRKNNHDVLNDEAESSKKEIKLINGAKIFIVGDVYVVGSGKQKTRDVVGTGKQKTRDELNKEATFNEIFDPKNYNCVRSTICERFGIPYGESDSEYNSNDEEETEKNTEPVNGCYKIQSKCPKLSTEENGKVRSKK